MKGKRIMKLSANDIIILSAVLHYMKGVASETGQMNMRIRYNEIDEEIRTMGSIAPIYYDEVKLALDEFKAVIDMGVLDELIERIE